MTPRRFDTVQAALDSLARSEKQECRVVHRARTVLVQTPEGLGEFAAAAWPLATAERVVKQTGFKLRLVVS